MLNYLCFNFQIILLFTDDNESFGKAWVIEINPFMNTTDGAMFSWEKEKDLLEGKHGFLFRVVERPKPGSLSMMPQSIRELIKTL